MGKTPASVKFAGRNWKMKGISLRFMCANNLIYIFLNGRLRFHLEPLTKV